MFVVLEGQAEVRVNGKPVATLPEQSLVGEVEFLDTLPASVEVVVLKETRLIELEMKELRRKDRAIPKEEAIALLNKAEYGVLSTVTEDGKPYGVPLNFCFIDQCIYFHCAVEGRKIENIKKNKFVSFCAVGNTEVLPDKFATRYESVIVSGEVEEVFDINKQIALEGLLHKYSPEFIDKGLEYIEAFIKKARVFKININQLSGKARR